MNYNDFTYHRANPFAREGYIPPIAHTNRHKPQFLTQLPMGQEHLGKIGKRQFPHSIQRSNIQSQSILKSPERYPFENRIALEKSYERNMNTVDIEGASSGTLVSPAVRNKLKAREELIRRQKETNSSHFEQLQHLQNTQQERRRLVAYQQYIKNQQLQQLNAGKVKPQNFETISHSNETIKKANNNLQLNPSLQPQNIYPRAEQRRNPSSDKYQTLEKPQYLPRHQSIQISRPSYNPESDLYESSYKQKPTYINQVQMSDSQIMNNFSNNYAVENEIKPKNIVMDRKQLRQQNPTVLSSQNSIYLAGRNLVGN